ncbi:MAG: class I SAM-dependent methyltransferase [Chloroflexi bacterium]|nr:class I SAM-dependent methyltransferase [Chloroflexota bacterium]
MTDRAAIIATHLAPHFAAHHRLLEIGAGKGLVAQAIQRATGAQISLVDVVDYNQTNLPLKVYDGQTLPFGDAAFDFSLLVFVLHHTPDPLPVLREALRVARLGVIIAENHVAGGLRQRLTRMIDSIPHLQYGVPICYRAQTIGEWQSTFEQLSVRADLLGRFNMNAGFWQNFVMRLAKR